MNRTSDLIFFNSGALPNILHYITLHEADMRGQTWLLIYEYTSMCDICRLSHFVDRNVRSDYSKMKWLQRFSPYSSGSLAAVCGLDDRRNHMSWYRTGSWSYDKVPLCCSDGHRQPVVVGSDLCSVVLVGHWQTSSGWPYWLHRVHCGLSPPAETLFLLRRPHIVELRVQLMQSSGDFSS